MRDGPFVPLAVDDPATACVFAITYTLCNGSTVTKHFVAANMALALSAFRTNRHTAGYLPDSIAFLTKVYI